jgi:hypothetical protein
MIPSLLLALVPAFTWISRPAPPLDAAALEAHARRCSGAESYDCRVGRARIERELYAVLRELRAERADLGAEVWRVALAAREPRLKALALDHLSREGEVGPADVPLVLEALESPFTGVRDAAVAAAARLPEPASRMAARNRGGSGRSRDGIQRLLEADPPPDPKAFGVALYPGARPSYLASTAERTVLVTPDPLDKVVAFYAKGGKRVLDADAVNVRAEPSQEDGMRMAQEMMAAMQAAMRRGEDPQAAMAKLAASRGGAGKDWTEGIEGVEGISGARYVAVEETTLGRKKVPSRVVAVYRDAILGGTAIVLHRVPDARAMTAGAGDPEATMRRIRIMQLQGLPAEAD